MRPIRALAVTVLLACGVATAMAAAGGAGDCGLVGTGPFAATVAVGAGLAVSTNRQLSARSATAL